MKTIFSLDLSYAKTGWSVIAINNNNKMTIVANGLITSNKKLEPSERIYEQVDKINQLMFIYNPDIIIKEGAIMGRSSTGLNVIKTHGAFEYNLTDKNITFIDIHNATIKAWCRSYLINYHDYTKEEIKQIDKKQLVAIAIEKYFNRTIDGIWTPKKKLIDDIADSIAMTLTAYHKELF